MATPIDLDVIVLARGSHAADSRKRIVDESFAVLDRMLAITHADARVVDGAAS